MYLLSKLFSVVKGCRSFSKAMYESFLLNLKLNLKYFKKLS